MAAAPVMKQEFIILRSSEMLTADRLKHKLSPFTFHLSPFFLTLAVTSACGGKLIVPGEVFK